MSTRRRQNTIVVILSRDGISLVLNTDMEIEFIDFYMTLYSKGQVSRLPPIIENWAPISASQSFDIEASLTEEEIGNAIKDLRSKSSGPDGYTTEFFQKHWNILKDVLKGVFQDFIQNAIINASLYKIYICLIPKKSDAESVGDYMPISLASCLYKIVGRSFQSVLRSSFPSLS